MLAGGSVLTYTYFSVRGVLAHALVYSLIGCTSAALIFLRARSMSEGRVPWLLLGAMQALWALGDLVWAGYDLVLHEVAPYPSVADWFYFGAYPVAMVGFLLYLRKRAGTKASEVFKDAAIVALLVGLSAWELVVHPYLLQSGLLSSGDLLGISYPIMDVLLLAVASALFIGPGAKLASSRLLMVGVAGIFFADCVYSFALLNGTYYTGIWYDAGWLLGFVLFASAAWHPAADVHEKESSVDSLGRHFRLLFVVALGTFGILLVQHFRGHDVNSLTLVIVGGAVILLAISRIGALYHHSQDQINDVKASEERYHSLLDNASDAIFILKDEDFTDVNDKACELTGYPREELLALPMKSLFLEPEKVANSMERERQGGSSIAEYHTIPKDGPPIPVEVSSRMLPDGRFQAIIRDIRDRRESENALRTNEEMLRKVFDSGVSGIGVGTADWKLIRVNRTFAHMLGYEPVEMEGMSLSDLTHPDEREAGFASVRSLVMGDAEEIKFEKRYLHRAGHPVWASVSLVVAHAADGTTLIVAHILDISHSKVLEESLRQAQMMEAVGQLAGGVAHDFNNLLSVIQNFTRFVYETLDPADPNREDLEEVLKAGDRGAGLVRQLLTMGRRERSASEVFDLNELISDMTVLLRRSLRESISLDLVLSDEDPHIEMDRSQLEQILLNLTVNARDAMAGGGDLSFRTDVVSLSLNEADLAQVEPGDYVRLRATDSGTGMTPEVRRRVFEPFFSTKERGAGTGLGLATVYGIVVGAKGGIVVNSEVNVGTTLDIFLPLVSQGPNEDIQPEITGSLGKDSCILVVDDEDGVRTIVQRILEANGYRVLCASGLDDALAISADAEVAIRAVISDVVMPNGSGLELVEQLRVQRPNLPALFISGYSGDVLTAHGLGREDRYIGKPFRPNEILSALSAIIGYDFAA